MTFPALDRIAALSQNLETWQRTIDGKLAELQETSAEGEGANGLIRVTAAPDGKILSTTLDPRALRLDSYTLAEEFTAAATMAQEAAAARVREMITDVVGRPGS